MLYLLLQMCLVLKLWFTVFWGEFFFFLRNRYTQLRHVNLWPFNSYILLLPLTRNPAFSLCISFSWLKSEKWTHYYIS